MRSWQATVDSLQSERMPFGFQGWQEGWRPEMES